MKRINPGNIKTYLGKERCPGCGRYLLFYNYYDWGEDVDIERHHGPPMSMCDVRLKTWTTGAAIDIILDRFGFAR